MLDKYWVAYSQMEYMVITDAWDSIAGNHYNTIASGFETEEEAKEHADKLNKKENELQEMITSLNLAKDLIDSIDIYNHYNDEKNIDLKWDAHTIILDVINKLEGK